MNKKTIAAAKPSPITVSRTASSPSLRDPSKTPTEAKPISPLSPLNSEPTYQTVTEFVTNKTFLEHMLNIYSGFCPPKIENLTELKQYIKNIRHCANLQYEKLISMPKRTILQENEFNLAQAVVDFFSPISSNTDREQAKNFLLGFT